MTGKKAFFAAAVAVFSMALVLLFGEAKAAVPEKNIILISWDGTQRNHLMELLDAGSLPGIAMLHASGKLIPVTVTGHHTDTIAGHSQMLTGYNPSVTGCFGDGRYAPVPEGLSIFERLENGLGGDNILTIMLTSKTHHLGSMPEGEYADSPGDKPKKYPAEPWLNARPHVDVWQGDKVRTADEVGAIAFDDLQKYADKRFFMFIHFSEPDKNGHAYGENSEQYNSAIITIDSWLVKIINELKRLGLDGSTLVYVTADHGFDEDQRQHTVADKIFLATNDTGITAKSGRQMDIVPTLLKREGIDPSALSPKLPGKPLF